MKSINIEQNDLETFEMVDPVVAVAEEEAPQFKQAASSPYWFKDKCSQLKKGVFQTPWDIYLDVLQKHSGGTLWKAYNFEEVFSPYMLCRFLSMDKSTIEAAVFLDVMNSRGVLSNAEMYKLAYKIVKPNGSWIPKYIKKEAEKRSAENEEEKPVSIGTEFSSIFEI